jgi:hypothetical protein
VRRVTISKMKRLTRSLSSRWLPGDQYQVPESVPIYTVVHHLAFEEAGDGQPSKRVNSSLTLR